MSIIDRAKAEALIREQIINSIQQEAPKTSVVMQLARKLPNMTSKQTTMPVLDMLPASYWVNGDTGWKQTSQAAWDNVKLTAAELAVIVPIPEAVLDDASFDIIGEITPRIIEAIGQRVDAAILFGEGKPAEWGMDLVSRARIAGNNVSATAGEDMYDLLLGEGGVFGKVEEDGYGVTGAVSALTMKAKLRGLRTVDGLPIFKSDVQGKTNYTLDGEPLYFPENGSFNKDVAQVIAGDWSQVVYAIRQDITTKILTEGVIQDPATGEIIYNLAQQDMVALRVVFRMGWAVANPATRLNEDRTGFMFAYLEPATAAKTQAVTVTVTDGTDPIKDAKVKLGEAIQKTDASGKAVFNTFNGDFVLEASKAGYSTASEVVSVDGSAVTKTIALTARK